MIQAKELRIGNIVNHTDDEDTWIMTIEAVTLDGCHTECNGIFDYIEPDLLEPIPLTEEWLVKFGFVESGSNFIINDELVIDLNDNSFGVYENEYETNWNFNVNMSHVHQLQNLYHALTGEELIIKE